MAINKDKVVEIFMVLLEDKEPYLEFTNNNSSCRHHITIEAENNIFGEESGLKVELVDDKIDRTFYLEFKNLRFLLEENEYIELHQSFFDVFYTQKNSLIFDETIIKEFDKIFQRIVNTDDELVEDAEFEDDELVEVEDPHDFIEHIRQMSKDTLREILPLTTSDYPKYIPQYTSKQTTIFKNKIKN